MIQTLKFILPSLLIFISLQAYAGNKFLEKKLKITKLPAKNTFVFWVNGDADRFRSKAGIGSSNIRLDVLDVENLKKLSKKCKCNTVIFHDQRGTDEWYTNSTYFGAFLYAFSNGTQVKFETIKRKKKGFGFKKVFKNTIGFNEITQDKYFLKDLLEFTKLTFKNTKYHLIYRGHSFANTLREVPAVFDHSNLNSNFHLEDLNYALLESKIKFETISFASCSMSNISFALELSKFSKFMIASQVNINETGDSGFSFEFLEKVNDSFEAKETANLIGHALLSKFRTVRDRQLFIRETPISVIDLKKLKTLENKFNQIVPDLKDEVKTSYNKFKRSKITIRVSKRYVDRRMKKGASQKTINLAIDKIKVPSNELDFDLIGLLKTIGQKALARELSAAINVYDNSDHSDKNGISLDLTF